MVSSNNRIVNKHYGYRDTIIWAGAEGVKKFYSLTTHGMGVRYEYTKQTVGIYFVG